jgi:hypothetical protein
MESWELVNIALVWFMVFNATFNNISVPLVERKHEDSDIQYIQFILNLFLP